MDKNTEGIVFMRASRTILSMLKSRESSGKVSYGHSISQESGITWSHISKVSDILEEVGLIEKGKREGRIVPFKLTKKGRKVADLLLKIEEILEGG